jgi:hypothetical protein
MTLASIDAGGDFRVGAVLSRAWSVFTGNIIFFLAVPLLTNAIYFLISHGTGKVYAALGIAPSVVVVGSPAMMAGRLWIIALISMITLVIYLCLYMFGQGVLLTGAFQRLRGEPLHVGAALQRASARFLPLVAASILVTLALMGVALGCFAIVWVLSRVLGGFATVLGLGTFIPMIMLYVMWSVVVPACLVEGLGPVASMTRSADLTRGHRWQIVGIMLLLILIAIAVLIVVGMLFAVLRFNPIVLLVVEVALTVAWTAYLDCTIIMTYHDLRVAKEGVDTAQIASVFD